MAAGREAAGDKLLDRVELAMADAAVWPMLAAGGVVEGADWADDGLAEAVVIVEVATVCAAIRGGRRGGQGGRHRDPRRQAGGRPRRQGGLHLHRGAAVGPGLGEAAAEAAGTRLVGLELIAQPAPELRGRLFR